MWSMLSMRVVFQIDCKGIAINTQSDCFGFQWFWLCSWRLLRLWMVFRRLGEPVLHMVEHLMLPYNHTPTTQTLQEGEILGV